MALPPPPPGVDLQDTQVPRILGVNIATFTMAVTAISLRFTARRLTRLPFWWDDWLMLPAIAAAATMMFVSTTYMIDHGLGRHVWTGPPDAAVAWAKGLFISEVSYTCIICCVKFSLLAFYWRIFKQSKIRIPIYVLVAVVSAWGLAVILITVFQCQPARAYWTRFAPTPPAPGSFKCGVNANHFFDGNSIPNIVTDAALLVLPMPFIWQLHLLRAQKLAVSSVFVLGIFVVCVSMARLTFVVRLNLSSPDITWNFVNVQIWTGVESHIGITCACLPSLRPILNLVLFGSIDRTHGRSRRAPPPSGGFKRHSSWYLQLRNKAGGGKNVPVSVTEHEEHGFIRLADRAPDSLRMSAGTSPQPLMNNGSRIHVRTDFYVETYDERAKLHDGEA